MPEIGEIKRGNEVGIKDSHNYIYHACIKCGKERWTKLDKTNKSRSIYCHACGTIKYSYVVLENNYIPKLGDIVKGSEIGYKSGTWIWQACINCNKERWVLLKGNIPSTLRCKSCGHLKYQYISLKNGYIPKLGDLIQGKYINKSGSYQWRSCPDCKRETWIQVRDKYRERCLSCANTYIAKTHHGENHHNWKGGRHVNSKDGYIEVYLKENDKEFISMGKRRRKKARNEYLYVFEHRLVMAKHLGRCLEKWEIVHHINGNKQDNRIENLELLQETKEHLPSMAMQQRIKELEKRATLLEAENALLKSERQLSAT